MCADMCRKSSNPSAASLMSTCVTHVDQRHIWHPRTKRVVNEPSASQPPWMPHRVCKRHTMVRQVRHIHSRRATHVTKPVEKRPIRRNASYASPQMPAWHRDATLHIESTHINTHQVIYKEVWFTHSWHWSTWGLVTSAPQDGHWVATRNSDHVCVNSW